MYRPTTSRLLVAVTTALLAATFAGCSANRWTSEQTVADPTWVPLDVSDAAWSFTDPGAWEIRGSEELCLVGASDYEPPVRSPLSQALRPDIDAANIVLEFEVRSTQRSMPHRDACIFFGYQDASHFYYAHLGQAADATAHGIFIVNGEPRRNIVEERTDGTPWDDQWHRVTLERNAATGRIAVYFDGEQVLLAHDTTFGAGAIGLGSFDDVACFRDVRVLISDPG